ncbi:MAG: hypothetical protein KatS3mg008_0563 [Acidimicrobiales bacterium]|nr:MAG: hypothetical protein KatS3mg008_0563 [Acidimicrobiales bacterium]
METGEETVLLSGDSVVLAPGSVPRSLEGLEPDGRVVVTSDEFFDLEEYPDRVLVVGGGVIGCEFASALCDLGVEVVILEATERILPGIDDDLVRILERSLRRRGVEIHSGVKISDVARDRSSVTVEWQEGGRCVAGLAVVAVGRRPRTETLDLAGSGVELDERGFIRVDGRCRTTRPGTWAVGDAVASPQLAHVAFAEGIVAVRDAMGEEPTPLDYDRVPWCIYTHPELAFVGLNERQALERGIRVTTVTQRYAGNGRALIIGEPEGLVKLVARVEEDASPVLMGVHMVGPWVTEQLSGPYLSVNWEASAADLSALIQPHPTLGEVFGEAAIALTGRRLH